MKKIKLKSEEFLISVINYMLREFDTDYKTVKEEPVINGVPWYEYYWDNIDSKQEFEIWLENFLRNKTNCRKREIKNVIAHIGLMWGLKLYDNE